MFNICVIRCVSAVTFFIAQLYKILEKYLIKNIVQFEANSEKAA